MDRFLRTLMLTVMFTPIFPTLNAEEFRPDYGLALRYSLLYYEAQRSGKLSENNRIKWRGDSALEDKGVNGEDLTGGYYDGTDFVKFSFTMAYTVTMLSWGVILYRDVYESIGQYNEVLDAIKWATDYFIKCHVSPNELYGQIGDFKADHKFWGRPEEMNMTRPSYKINGTHPGSDLAGEVSAVFSSASIIFRDVDATYADELLRHSVELYEFADKFRGLSKDVIPGAKQYYYEIYSYGDQLAWAAVWLFKATNDSKYLNDAERFHGEFLSHDANSTFFFYNNQTVGVRLLLGEITKNETYLGSVRDFCDYAVYEAPKTPKGLVFIRQYGALALAANTAFICLEAASLEDLRNEKYIEFAKTQIDYILGSTGQSYVVGYGENYPQKPYHSSSSCPDLPLPCGWHRYNSTGPNPQILYGALVSGPNVSDHYVDQRDDLYLNHNVVSMDFNAGFQNALAGLAHYGRRDVEIRKEENLGIIPL